MRCRYLRRTLFIVLEGIDGSGKTTIAKFLVEWLNSIGLKAIYTYEPYDEKIVKIIESKGRELGAIMEVLLLAADRYYHITKVIKPYLNMGYFVVCDRYYYSTLAYQGARGANLDWIRTVNYFVIKPDLAIYLDVEPKVGIERVRRVSRGKMRYLEDINLLNRVRELYLKLVSEGELIYVDARKDLDEVKKDVMEIVKKAIKAH